MKRTVPVRGTLRPYAEGEPQVKSDLQIAAFPREVSKDEFGHWLSGFVDGEGCFLIRHGRQHLAVFEIGLRDDDLPILQLVQSYFGCGTIYFKHSIATYKVWDTVDLVTYLLPHFEKYPLRGKKANDFRIWKEAVLFLQRMRGIERASRWCPENVAHFERLSKRLKQSKTYIPARHS